MLNAPIAQLDRASDYGGNGKGSFGGKKLNMRP